MFAFILTILGLLFGSFANVCIWRIPRREEIVYTPSHCPRCGAAIRWYDNIPLASFLLLRGRCRHCKEPIPWRYPLVELTCGALFLLLALKFGPDWRLAGYLPLAWALLVIAGIDITHYIIPDAITVSGIAAGIAFALAAVWLPSVDLSVLGFGFTTKAAPLLDSVGGVVAGGGLIALAGWLGKAAYKQEAMGGGDIKLAAMIGAVMGWKAALLAVFFGVLSGTVIGLLLLALGKTRDTRELQRTVFAGDASADIVPDGVAARAAVPFGPFLAAGALATVFAGPLVLRWYIGLFL
jgi:leader peptidase (prepilin peptidase) / N-methyltransferase